MLTEKDLWPELEELGEVKVRLNLAMGVYGKVGNKRVLVEEWLHLKDRERADASRSEQVSAAERASLAAKRSADASERSADASERQAVSTASQAASARDAAREAKTANNIATIAMVGAAIAIIVSIIGLILN